MASDSVWTRTGPARQRLLWIVAVVAAITAYRERSFNRNRSKYGSPHS